MYTYIYVSLSLSLFDAADSTCLAVGNCTHVANIINTPTCNSNNNQQMSTEEQGGGGTARGHGATNII